MTEKSGINRSGNAAVASIEDDEGSFSFCDAHFGDVTSAARHQGLSLAAAPDSVTLGEQE